MRDSVTQLFKRVYLFFTNFDRQTSNLHWKIIIEPPFNKLAILSTVNGNLWNETHDFLDYRLLSKKNVYVLHKNVSTHLFGVGIKNLIIMQISNSNL